MFSSAFFLIPPHCTCTFYSLHRHTPLGSSAFSPLSSFPIMPNKRMNLCYQPRLCKQPETGASFNVSESDVNDLWSLLDKKRLKPWEWTELVRSYLSLHNRFHVFKIWKQRLSYISGKVVFVFQSWLNSQLFQSTVIHNVSQGSSTHSWNLTKGSQAPLMLRFQGLLETIRT